MKLCLALASFAVCHSLAMANCLSTGGLYPEGAQLIYSGTTYICSQSNWYAVANGGSEELPQPDQPTNSTPTAFSPDCPYLDYGYLAQNGIVYPASNQNEFTVISYNYCRYFVDNGVVVGGGPGGAG